MTSPTVRVVVVNFNGGDLTLECLRSLRATIWPKANLQLVMVDNGSTDDVVSSVRRDHPEIHVIEAGANKGFGAGCNVGLRQLQGVDFVALVNPDAAVEPGWLVPLVAAFEEGEKVGAAAPKILLAPSFVDVTIDSPTRVRGRGDRRPLGLRYCGLRVGGADRFGLAHLADGSWGTELGPRDQPYVWTSGRALLRVPVFSTDPTPVQAEIRLTADTVIQASLVTIAGARTIRVGPEPTWFPITLEGKPYDVINSTGSVLVAGEFGADRGYLEPDIAQYDDAVDVPGWSGAAVLLSRQYLEDIGLFDERYFLYYEDFELAWRGRRRGWRYRYVPESVVRHVHSATTDETSPLFAFYNERNRLLTLARHATGRRAACAAARSLLVTASYARRDIVSPLLSGRSPRPRATKVRAHAFLSFLRLLPRTVRARFAVLY